MRDRLSGHEGVSRATETMMHSRQGRNRRLSEDEHASDAPDRGGWQQAPEKSSSPSSPAGSWAFSNGNGRNKSPSREERASDAHPQGGGRQRAPERSRAPSQLAGSNRVVRCATDDEHASGTRKAEYRQQAPARCRDPSRPAGSKVVASGDQSQYDSHGNRGAALVRMVPSLLLSPDLRVTVERLAQNIINTHRMTRFQGKPCLNQQRGNRGRIPNEPYGESSPLPPPRTTMCGW